jgi:hypothetical protein
MPSLVWVARLVLVWLGFVNLCYAETSRDPNAAYQICPPDMALAQFRYALADRYALVGVPYLETLPWRETILDKNPRWIVMFTKPKFPFVHRTGKYFMSTQFEGDFPEIVITTSACDLTITYPFAK